MIPIFGEASGWAIASYILVRGHLTTKATTLYLHRSVTHKTVKFAGAVEHFFRFILWWWTSTVTKEWVSIHRKHHSVTDEFEDPHSPKHFGIWTVLLKGWHLYQIEAKDKETLKSYGSGTPDDWIERHLYTPGKYWGILSLLPFDMMLFGWWGILTWACQMVWIPLLAAGILNGLGHYFGYRNYDTNDDSRNILPFCSVWLWPISALLFCGEEYHNNHHGKVSSAKFSRGRWEFDMGWVYIRALTFLGLATLAKSKTASSPH